MKYFAYKIAGIAVFTALFIGCGMGSKKPSMPVLKLKVSKVVSDTVENEMTFIGRTIPGRSYIIQPRVSGFLLRTNFDNGKPVKKGQLLFEIDPEQYQILVAEALSNLKSAQASSVEAQNTYNRSVPLARMNAISQSQLDAATANLISAKEAVNTARAKLKNAKLDLSYTKIYAPDDGIVSVAVPNDGDYVGLGTAYTDLTDISFNDTVSVTISMPTAEYYKVAGRERPSYLNDSLLSDIRLYLSDGTLYSEPGFYKYTKQSIDAQSGSILLQTGYPNPRAMLKSGQYARVVANVGRPVVALMIPAVAVVELQGTYNVFVVDSTSRVHFRAVTPGRVYGSNWVIESGLKAGETVLVEGLQKVRSGEKIEMVKSIPSAPKH